MHRVLLTHRFVIMVFFHNITKHKAPHSGVIHISCLPGSSSSPADNTQSHSLSLLFASLLSGNVSYQFSQSIWRPPPSCCNCPLPNVQSFFSARESIQEWFLVCNNKKTTCNIKALRAKYAWEYAYRSSGNCFVHLCLCLTSKFRTSIFVWVHSKRKNICREKYWDKHKNSTTTNESIGSNMT